MRSRLKSRLKSWLKSWLPKPLRWLLEGIRSSCASALSIPGRISVLRGFLGCGSSGRGADLRVPLHHGAIHLDPNHEPDWGVFGEVFVNEDYSADYRDALVIDIGAHRGMFAAYALSRGAKIVFCFEPAPANLEYLGRTLQEFSASGVRSEILAKAVGARPGSVRFFIYDQSWSHSVVRRQDRQLQSEIEVEAVTLEWAVAYACESRRNGERIVVKIDAEGAEYDILLATPPMALAPVAELFVETHGYIDREPRDLLDHIGRSGLTPCGADDIVRGQHNMLHLRRAEA